MKRHSLISLVTRLLILSFHDTEVQYTSKKTGFTIPNRTPILFLRKCEHSGDYIYKTEMGRAWSTYGKRIRSCRVLVGKPQGRPLARPRRRWEDNIKMVLREVECGGTDCIIVAQDRERLL